MWICGRRKGLIREIWARVTPLSAASGPHLEEAYETLLSLDGYSLRSLSKGLRQDCRDDCLPLRPTSPSSSDELIHLLWTLKLSQQEFTSSHSDVVQMMKPLCNQKKTNTNTITKEDEASEDDLLCLNTRHWNFILRPDPPQLPHAAEDSMLEEEEKKRPRGYGEASFSLTTAGSMENNAIEGVPWCKVAYWEENTRVGPMFPVLHSSVDVFSEFLKGSGLSLSSIFTQNKNPSTSTRETRKKIGRGLSLSQESNGLWIHNKSSSSLFVNSPTLDFHPLTGKFIVYKVPPGHSLLAFDTGLSFPPLRKRRENMTSCSPRRDERSVRVSFAKGWGDNYRRPNVTNCPCWIEIMLN